MGGNASMTKAASRNPFPAKALSAEAGYGRTPIQMKRPCLAAESKNHSTRNLRLWLKRSWNFLSYSRSTHLSGTPSNTTAHALFKANRESQEN